MEKIMSKTNDETMNHNTEVGELTTDELLQVSGGSPAIIAGLIILAGTLAFDIAEGVFDGVFGGGVRGAHTERPL
jgi:hypothetical protein